MEIEASVLIPAKNAGEEFEQLLEKVNNQKKVKFEVLVVDSGSSDGTAEKAEEKGARVERISPNEFGHGKTRNFIAKKARGKYLAFLTHDAIPSSNLWLYNLIQPLKEKNIVGSYGKQIPRTDSIPTEIFFYRQKYGNKEIIWNNRNWREENIVFSNANSAVKKDFFLKEPFSEKTIVSEDYEWAFRAMQKGYNIAYEPSAAVIHSHNFGLIGLFKRHFDIGYSYSQIYSKYDSKGFFSAGIKFYTETTKHLAEQKKYEWIPYFLLSGAVKFFGLYFGRKGKNFPKWVKKSLSNQEHYWDKNE